MIVAVRGVVVFVMLLGVAVVVVPVVLARAILALRQPWLAAPAIALILTKGLLWFPHQRLALVPPPKACLGGMPAGNMDKVACAVCDQLVAKEDASCTNQPKSGKPASYRCTKCNSLQTRIYRAKGSIPWPSNEAKKDFFQQHSALTGQELKKELEITLSQVEKERARDYDEQVAEWLDEIDLQAKYKDKPAQLKSILEKAEKREHPTRGVTLYADITYLSQRTGIVEVETAGKRKATSHEVLKAAKKIKDEKQEKQKRGPSSAFTAKPLATSQRAKLAKIEQKLGQVKEEHKQFGEYKEDPIPLQFLATGFVSNSREAHG